MFYPQVASYVPWVVWGDAEVSRAKRPSRSALLRRDFWVRGRENSQKPIGWLPEKSKFKTSEKTSIGYPDYPKMWLGKA